MMKLPPTVSNSKAGEETIGGEFHIHPSFLTGDAFQTMAQKVKPKQTAANFQSRARRDQSSGLWRQLKFVGQHTGEEGIAQRRSRINPKSAIEPLIKCEAAHTAWLGRKPENSYAGTVSYMEVLEVAKCLEVLEFRLASVVRTC